MARKSIIWRLHWCHFWSKWLLYPLCYYLIRYRRKVVRQNLLMAFPEKDLQQIIRIERGFYLAFCDMIVEIWVGRHFNNTDMQHFFTLNNSEPVAESAKHYGGAFAILGHFMNWEWMTGFATTFADYGIDSGIIYKRLSNPFFDRMMLRLRANKGGQTIEMNQLLRLMVKQKQQPDAQPMIYAMLADQRPRRNATQHYTTFLHRNVGFLTGTEQLAKRFRYPIFYTRYRCLARGHYEMTFVRLYDPDTEPDLPFGTVTERFVRLLEEDIKQYPAQWLWSHRRFAGSTPIDNPPDNK